MLALKRKAGETIRVGDSIVIHVVRVKGGQVKIGVEAGMEIKVLRGELVDVPRRTDGGNSDGSSSG